MLKNSSKRRAMVRRGKTKRHHIRKQKAVLRRVRGRVDHALETLCVKEDAQAAIKDVQDGLVESFYDINYLRTHTPY